MNKTQMLQKKYIKYKSFTHTHTHIYILYKLSFLTYFRIESKIVLI